MVKYAERICELWAGNAGKNKQLGMRLVGYCPGILPTAHYCRMCVQLGQPMWCPLPWQQ